MTRPGRSVRRRDTKRCGTPARLVDRRHYPARINLAACATSHGIRRFSSPLTTELRKLIRESQRASVGNQFPSDQRAIFFHHNRWVLIARHRPRKMARTKGTTRRKRDDRTEPRATSDNALARPSRRVSSTDVSAFFLSSFRCPNTLYPDQPCCSSVEIFAGDIIFRRWAKQPIRKQTRQPAANDPDGPKIRGAQSEILLKNEVDRWDRRIAWVSKRNKNFKV